MFTFFPLLIIFISLIVNSEQAVKRRTKKKKEREKVYYNFSDFDEKTKYSPIELNYSLYNSSDVCVTVFDLIAFHYTAKLADISPEGNVFPENFCYGMINYNITRLDFQNIVTKNVNAFKKYRSLIPFYIFTNYTGRDLLDDGCIGYFKLISCLSEFPSCDDNGDGTFTAHPICNSVCVTYKRRCTDYYFPQFCARNSSHGYCPSTSSDKSWFLDINLILLILVSLFSI